VDYSQLPLSFADYSRDDQVRILARMLAILKAERDHLDLENDAPFPVESIPFEEALAQVETWM
jgi:hypothetical protein